MIDNLAIILGVVSKMLGVEIQARDIEAVCVV